MNFIIGVGLGLSLGFIVASKILGEKDNINSTKLLLYGLISTGVSEVLSFIATMS